MQLFDRPSRQPATEPSTGYRAVNRVPSRRSTEPSTGYRAVDRLPSRRPATEPSTGYRAVDRLPSRRPATEPSIDRAVDRLSSIVQPASKVAHQTVPQVSGGVDARAPTRFWRPSRGHATQPVFDIPWSSGRRSSTQPAIEKMLAIQHTLAYRVYIFSKWTRCINVSLHRLNKHQLGQDSTNMIFVWSYTFSYHGDFLLSI